MLEEKKDAFNSQDKNFMVISKENGYCKENSVLDEIFSFNAFDREKASNEEILGFLEEKIEETHNI